MIKTGNYYQVSERGLREIQFLRSLKQNTQRDVYLEGACSSLIALPVGVIRDALLNEPELKQAASLPTARWLLEPAKEKSLYDEFHQLKSAIGVEVKDLIVPAIAWLTYLGRGSHERMQLS